MADIRGKSPSMDNMLGVADTKGGMIASPKQKPGGDKRVSGHQNAASDARVAPNTTVAGRA